MPRRSIKPLTDVDPNFVLHSDVRAAEREKVSILITKIASFLSHNHHCCFVALRNSLTGL